MVDRRKFLTLTAASLAAPAFSSQRAFAEGFPKQDVKIVVGFEAGGATDIIARTLAERLKEVWGKPVAVENKPGQGGNVAAELVAKAEPDGHTIFIVGPGQALNKFMYPKLNYDPVKDFAPVTLLVSQPNVMAVSTNSQFRSVQEFIDYCKANPGKATYASSGAGTSLHLSGELFEHLAKVEMKHVPYKGSEPALREVLLERADVIFDNVTSVLPHVMSGSARALAVTTARRAPAAPNRADADRVRPCRLRRGVVVCVLRAGADAGQDRRKDPRRRGRSARQRQGEGPPARARLRDHRLVARTARHAPAVRDGPLGPDDQESGHQGGGLTGNSRPIRHCEGEAAKQSSCAPAGALKK